MMKNQLKRLAIAFFIHPFLMGQLPTVYLQEIDLETNPLFKRNNKKRK